MPIGGQLLRGCLGVQRGFSDDPTTAHPQTRVITPLLFIYQWRGTVASVRISIANSNAYTILRLVVIEDASVTGGPLGLDPLRRLPPPPPPPPSLLGFGPEVPDHGRRRRPKEILLDLIEGEMGFHPMCLYSKYSVFLGEPHSG